VYFHLEQWHWWALCLTFMVIAALVRGSWPLSVAAGSGVLGAVSWLTPEVPTTYQLMLFFLIAIGGVAVSDFFVKPKAEGETEDAVEDLHIAGGRYTNKVITLETPIVNGTGSVVLNDVEWRLRGEDSAIGDQVRVLSADGIDHSVLIVERVEDEVV